MADAHALELHPPLAHHFDDLQQQHEAAELGMWVFLVTEVMFFGGIFAAYVVLRLSSPGYPGAAPNETVFAAASHEFLDVPLGAANTIVLLCSSLTMALAVHSAREGHRRMLMGMLLATIVLGGAFLGIKAVEYHHKYVHHAVPLPALGFEFHFDPEHLPPGGHESQAELFMVLYFVSTGLHALHMVIGLVVLAILLAAAARGRLLGVRYMPVHVTGLYWHFVDIVWVFLFPFLYLVGAKP